MATFTPEELEKFKRTLNNQNSNSDYEVIPYDETNPKHQEALKKAKQISDDEDRASLSLYGKLPYDAPPGLIKSKMMELFPEKSENESSKKQSATQKKSESEASVNKPLSSQDRKILGLPEEKVMSFLQKNNTEDKLLSDIGSQPQNEDYLKLLQKQKEEEQKRPKAGRLVWNSETGTQEFVKTEAPQMKISDLWNGSTAEDRASSQYNQLNNLRELDKNRDDSVKKSSRLQALEDILNKTKLPERSVASETSTEPMVEKNAKAQTGLVSGKVKSPSSVESETDETRQLASATEDTSKKPEETDILALLEKAKQSRNEQQLLANLGMAGETLSSALGGMVSRGTVTKPTGTDFYKSLAKQAEDRISDVGTQVSLQAKQEDINRAIRRRDPSSDESLLAKETYKELFGKTAPENLTAEAFEKVAPTMTNLMSQREAREARKQEFQIRMADIASRKDLSKDQKQEAFIQSLRKETTSGPNSKLFLNFNTTKKIQKALLEFEKDPTGYTDYATLMGGLKALQGDESVVREAEIRLGMNAASLATQVENWTQRLISGKSLSKEQRQDIIKAVRVLSDVARNQYKEAIQPIMNQAASLDIDAKKLVSEGLLGDFSVKTDKVETQTKKQLELPKDKKYIPGSRITTKKGSYIVDPNGLTATEE